MSAPKQTACDDCSQGVMDWTNPHYRGFCECPCHDESLDVILDRMVPSRLKSRVLYVHATTSDRTRAVEIAERLWRDERRYAYVADVSDLNGVVLTKHSFAVMAQPLVNDPATDRR